VTGGPARRLVWASAGLVCVALGGVGIVVPGLPTTIFFILAAAAFSRSSPRLEAWVLGLPRIGPAIADHRAGLGMPGRAKAIAITMIVVCCGLSVALLDSAPVRMAVAGLGLVGVTYLTWRVPTRARLAPCRPTR